MKKSLARLVPALLILGLLPSTALAVPMEVTFEEVILPTLTLLDGTNFYDPFGLSFDDSTFYAVDSRFAEDDYGITNTGGPNSLVTVVFNTPVSSVDFSWLTISSQELTAQAFNSANVLVDTFFVATPGGNTNGMGSVTGPGISRITWTDSNGSFGIDSLRFDVPEPGSLMLLGVGLVAAAVSRRRRKH